MTKLNNKCTIESYMMTVLSKRLESIIKGMTNTVLRSSRSGVMNIARDFSCSIVTGDGRLLLVTEGIPCHLSNRHYHAQALLELFGNDIHEGDDFLNNAV